MNKNVHKQRLNDTHFSIVLYVNLYVKNAAFKVEVYNIGVIFQDKC